MTRPSRSRRRPLCWRRLLTVALTLCWTTPRLVSGAPEPGPAPVLLPDPAPSPAPILAPSPAATPAPVLLPDATAVTPAPAATPATVTGAPPPAAAAASPAPAATPARGGKTTRHKPGAKGRGDAVAARLDPATPAAGAPVYAEADCISLAIRQNPDVLAAAKRVEASAATITTAKGPLFPTLAASGFYQRLDQSIANGGAETSTVNAQGQTVLVPTDFNRPNDYYGDVRVTQSLFSGFAVRNRIAAAKLQTEALGFEYQAQLDVTTLSVRAAFYNTLYAESSISVRQQAVDLLGAQLKDQQDRFAAGSVGQLNVNRFQVALANERPTLLDAQAALSTAYATLAQALGVSYPTGSLQPAFRVRGTLEVRPVTMTLNECLQRAQAMRPEVKGRLLAIEALKHLVGVEKSTTRPQITAYAAYDLYSEPDIRTVDSYYSGYTLGITASWTIFDGFATRGRVRTAQAQVGEAEAQLIAIRKQVQNDVYTAFTDLRSAESSLHPLSDNIRLASETLDLTTRNFDAGLTTQLDVLQARVDLTRSRSAELAGRLAYNTALARLERAMSMGRPTEGDATARLDAK